MAVIFNKLKWQPALSLVAVLITLLTITIPSSEAPARLLDEVIETKFLRVFVYENYPPFSFKDKDGKLKGIDVEIGKYFADKLGVKVEYFVRGADETVDDDLRNNVWKGHYLGGRPADVMMHVPVDEELKKRNELAHIFGRYYTERMALLINPKVIGEGETLAVFLSNKVGVELDSLADFYLSSPSTFRGALRNNVVRYRYWDQAIEGMKKNEVGGLMGVRSELEHIAKKLGPHIKVISPPFHGMTIERWDIGMAVNIDSRDLAYELGDYVIELRKSGELAKIYAKYGVTYFKDFLD